MVGVASACTATTVEYAAMSRPPEPITSPEALVYLVGDAGYASPGRDSVLTHLHAELTQQGRSHPDAPILVIFLGDNIYEVGAREDFRSEDLAKLAAQVEAVPRRDGTRTVFLPGNHDWAKGADEGTALPAVRLQERWLDELADGGEVGFLPSDGCPGPSMVHVGGDVHVAFLDTEWLLRDLNDSCGSAEDFYARLSDELAARPDDRILLAAHHPMATGGPHGGNVGALDHGPFVYYLAVKSGLSAQDLMSGRYEQMLQGLRAAIEESGVRPLAYASGHDHSLQVIGLEGADQPAFQLVSGSGSKTSPVEAIAGTRYANARHGYMRLAFTSAGTQLLVFGQSSEGGSVGAVFACALSRDAPATCSEAPLLAGTR